MAGQVGGFPYWEMSFDEAGAPTDPSAVGALVAGVPAAGVTDLFVFSHGWNNSPATARLLYQGFFENVAALLQDTTLAKRPATIGLVGVIWPSLRWADEAMPRQTAMLAAPRPASDAELVRALEPVFPGQQATLGELADMLERRRPDRAELRRFKRVMARLAVEPDATAAVEDDGERVGLLGGGRGHELDVFERFAGAARKPRNRARTAAFGSPFDVLWNGAREALRQLTYWQMKKRAGTVGQTGLGPVLGRLHAAAPETRLHLLGHSFGARLVSFSLAGLPDDGGPSPVKSLFLLQGAFSHFAFAGQLPHDPSRGGALAGMTARVDGPLVVSFTGFDTAVGDLYPLASVAAGDDASAVPNVLFRWGAMGHDGAQAVAAAVQPLGPVGTSYPLAAGRFLNLDANAVIKTGGPPAGAHSDIFHPELAWVALAAAGIAAQG